MSLKRIMYELSYQVAEERQDMESVMFRSSNRPLEGQLCPRSDLYVKYELSYQLEERKSHGQ